VADAVTLTDCKLRDSKFTLSLSAAKVELASDSTRLNNGHRESRTVVPSHPAVLAPDTPSGKKILE